MDVLIPIYGLCMILSLLVMYVPFKMSKGENYSYKIVFAFVVIVW